MAFVLDSLIVVSKLSFCVAYFRVSCNIGDVSVRSIWVLRDRHKLQPFSFSVARAAFPTFASLLFVMGIVLWRCGVRVFSFLAL